MRDNLWLESRLSRIWQLLFPELEKKNSIIIKFKGSWKNKFGHIKLLKNKSTEIAVNGLFANEEVPFYIIDLTIAHELIHYMHGFQSPYEKKFSHPHKGGIINQELKRRGFTNFIKLEKEFIKNDWLELYKKLKENY